MNPLLKEIVNEVKADHRGVRRNPGPDEVDSPVLDLQEKIVDYGLEYKFSEKDMIEAFKSLGLDNDDAVDALQSFASWL